MPSQCDDAVYLPGSTRPQMPEDGYVVTDRSGIWIRYLVDGHIEGHVPFIHSLSIADISQIVRHEIVPLYDTVSHTLHFEGGGVFSYLHGGDGQGYEFNGRHIIVDMDDGGHVIVLGTCPE